MIPWVDAQLSPALARWICETFQIEAQAVRDLGLRNAKDPVIFKAARAYQGSPLGCSHAAVLENATGRVLAAAVTADVRQEPEDL